MSNQETGVGAKAGRREWIGLAVLALPCLLYSMDLTVLNLAIPHLTADLKPTGAQLLWIVDIYGFLVAGSLITMGTLGDRIGRRKLLMIGAVAFGAASVLAAFSTTPEMLIFARAVLGVAAATLAPSTLSLLRNMFHDPRQRTLAIGIWITSFSAGGALGPLVGGVMLQYFWWGSVFLIALPIMALLLALGPVLLPEFRDENAGRLDLASAALSLVAVLSVIFGLKEIATEGASTLAFAAIAGGIVLGWVFARRQTRLADPLIDLSLFRFPAFSASLAINIAAFFAAFASFLMVAQYLQLVLGMTPLRAGLWSLPGAIAFIVGAQITPRVAHRMKPSRLMASGLVVAAVGFLVLAQAGGEWSLAAIVAGTTILSIGLVPVFTMTTDLVVGVAPPERAGSAAAISETSAEFGGALGIAVLGSIAAAVYRLAMARSLPADLPGDAATAARDTIGGAIGAAATLPPDLADAVTWTARAAYSSAFSLAAAISAGLLVATAILALIVLRGLPPIGGAEAAADPHEDRDCPELVPAK
ncbi:MAG: MFS transporter [Rhizobiaceae bacterium]|nr:MFS transporter [Rhizobiaceae bacterium]MCV0405459.1 MFS transporter [Rhizobiaceae bacterium]